MTSTSDEEAARRLLEGYLRQFLADATCTLVASDPPDIACQIGHEAWAVEVTRVNQLEVYEGNVKARVELDVPLMAFGNELGECTRPGLSYLLLLQGPTSKAKWQAWKRTTRNLVERFVQSNVPGKLEFEGGSITARRDARANWSVAILPRDGAVTPNGAPSYDISANIDAMLRNALRKKASRLARVTGYERIGLVLLNTYFFGDDIDAIRQALKRVIHEDSAFGIFDFLFYVSQAGFDLVFERQSGLFSPLSQAG